MAENKVNQQRKSEYYELLDILNEFPEFFNEGEVGCPEVVVARIKELGATVWGEDTGTGDLSLLSKEEYSELCKTMTDAAIASKYSVNRSALNRWKQANNVKRKRRQKYDHELIYQLYISGNTQAELALKFNTVQSHISVIISKGREKYAGHELATTRGN